MVFFAALLVFFDCAIYWILIPNFVEGILGYSEGFRMGCFSLLSDITTLEDRSFRLTLMECLVMMTGAVSNLGFGYLINDSGYLLPYAVSSGVQLANIVLILVMIPAKPIHSRVTDELENEHSPLLYDELSPLVQNEHKKPVVSCDYFKGVWQLFKGEITPGRNQDLKM